MTEPLPYPLPINNCGKDDCTPAEHWKLVALSAHHALAATPPAPRIRPEWLATIDDTVTLLNGMGRYGLATRLIRLRKGLAALSTGDET